MTQIDDKFSQNIYHTKIRYPKYDKPTTQYLLKLNASLILILTFNFHNLFIKLKVGACVKIHKKNLI